MRNDGFYDAKPLAALRMLPSTVLKALSSPKPPAPSLYFHSATQNQPARKSNLNLEADKPNGRKVYIPHPQAQIDRQDWTSHDTDRSKLRLKMRCEPMDSGQSLYFHIDFENIDAAELTLLQTALRSDANFLHRLGLGKPLGLGAVQLETIGVFFIERLQRYTVAGLHAPRYAKLARLAAQWPEALTARYPTEAAAFANAELISTPCPVDERFIDRQTKSAIIQLGSTHSFDANLPVRYPYTLVQGESDETEIFQWFVNNERAVGRDYQALSRIAPGARLRGLNRNQE